LPTWADETGDNHRLLVDSAEIRQKVGKIGIFTYDAFNALVDGKRDEETLRYWMDVLNQPYATIGDKFKFTVGEHDALIIDPAVSDNEQRRRNGDFTFGERLDGIDDMPY
jgi:hypothetical protein